MPCGRRFSEHRSTVSLSRKDFIVKTPHLSDEELKALLQGFGREEQPSEDIALPEIKGPLVGNLSGKKRLGLRVFNLFRDFRRGRFSHIQWSKSVYRQILSSNTSPKRLNSLSPCIFDQWLNEHSQAIQSIVPAFVQELSHQHRLIHEKVQSYMDFRSESSARTAEFLDLFYEESMELLDILNELDKRVAVYMAYRDPLTEVYSREMIAPLLRTEMNRIQRAGHSSSLAMLNVGTADKALSWNGEEERNLVLSEVASFLVRATRPYDFILRVDREGFLCVFPETDVQTAAPIVSRLSQGVRKIDLEGLKVPLEMSMTAGLSLLSPQVEIGKNLKRADAALEIARKKGNGSVCILDEDETPSFLF